MISDWRIEEDCGIMWVLRQYHNTLAILAIYPPWSVC